MTRSGAAAAVPNGPIVAITHNSQPHACRAKYGALNAAAVGL
jgi:hypothetical protein